MQKILHYSPLKTGFIFLPVSAAIVVSAQICAKQLVKVGPKPFMVLGAIMCASGLWWLSLVNVHSTYVANLLGPLVIFGLGMGFMFVPLTMIAVSGVEPQESGSASGLLNVMQQVGGSLGLAILTTAFATAQRHVAAGSTDAQKLAHGISVALQVSVVFGVGSLLGEHLLDYRQGIRPRSVGDAWHGVAVRRPLVACRSLVADRVTVGTQPVGRPCLELDAAGDLVRRSADAVRQHHDVGEADFPAAVVRAEAVVLTGAVASFEGRDSR